jgi:hypothetical protein
MGGTTHEPSYDSVSRGPGACSRLLRADRRRHAGDGRGNTTEGRVPGDRWGRRTCRSRPGAGLGARLAPSRGSNARPAQPAVREELVGGAKYPPAVMAGVAEMISLITHPGLASMGFNADLPSVSRSAGVRGVDDRVAGDVFWARWRSARIAARAPVAGPPTQLLTSRSRGAPKARPLGARARRSTRPGRLVGGDERPCPACQRRVRRHQRNGRTAGAWPEAPNRRVRELPPTDATQAQHW